MINPMPHNFVLSDKLLADAFGRSRWFGIGMFFLPMFFLPVLGFDGSKYGGYASS